MKREEEGRGAQGRGILLLRAVLRGVRAVHRNSTGRAKRQGARELQGRRAGSAAAQDRGSEAEGSEDQSRLRA